MNRFRMTVIAVLALGLSVLVTFVVYRALNKRLNASATDTRAVVVAAEKLPLGTKLEERHLRAIAWPSASLPEGSFASPQELVGRGIVLPVVANEPIVESKLAPREAGAGLTSAIPEGMRAVAVKVNDVIGVAGFALPGTRVDVILTGSAGERGQTDTSKIVLENVQVLAAGQNVEQDASGKPQNVQVITLLLTPEDTQKLALASEDGKIQLALRNPLDLKKSDPEPARKSALYSRTVTLPEKPVPAVAAAKRNAPARRQVTAIVSTETGPAPPPPPKLLNVELIQGNERKSVSFEIKTDEK
ncbi:MAG: Flp pilus assembly protein CpaB [Acidobacteria bacterium]|nr:MAG: Flp pilus assembly protein CpaB [Acidobacteriota bacterium]